MGNDATETEAPLLEAEMWIRITAVCLMKGVLMMLCLMLTITTFSCKFMLGRCGGVGGMRAFTCVLTKTTNV